MNSPTALWWKQLATAVVFGLGIATVLTLIFTPSMLALRVWTTTYVTWFARLMAKLSLGRTSRAAQDWVLNREARRLRAPEIIWDDERDNQNGFEGDMGDDGPSLDAFRKVLGARGSKPLKAAE